MGMFMDGLSMLVISIPVVFPVIHAMGFKLSVEPLART